MRNITIPVRNSLKIGTLSAILAEVASYLETDRSTLATELFS